MLLRTSSIFAHVPAESLIRERQSEYYGALAASDRLGRCDPFLEFMLEILLAALGRVSAQLRGRPESNETRVARAHEELGRRWFSRKDYLALFPRLSTASASRDLAAAVTTGKLYSQGERALMRYRFR